jgi:hypothetical protein
MPYQFGTGGFYQPNEPPHTPIRDNTPRSPKAWVSEDTSDDEGEQQPGLKHQFIPRQALPAEFHSSNNHEVPPASIGVSGLHSSQQYPGIDTTSVQSSGRAYATVIGGTPYRKNPPPRTHPSKQSVKDHAALLMQAQGDVAKSVEGYYLNQFGVVPGLSTAEIMPWLSQEANQSRGVFINGHWNVPQDPPKENLLYEPFEAVLNSILEKFVKPHCGPGVSRRVIDTHGAKVRHGDGHFTSPDLLVRATGASFDAPLTNFGYGDVATFFELKLDGQLDEPIHIHQMVVYARCVLILLVPQPDFSCLCTQTLPLGKFTHTSLTENLCAGSSSAISVLGLSTTTIPESRSHHPSISMNAPRCSSVLWSVFAMAMSHSWVSTTLSSGSTISATGRFLER